jgi:phthalate 4,5-dioxygenase
MMSKHKDSVDLLLTGAGTPMGEMMRQYWIPAVMSSELECDGAPMRLALLGEKLIAFRDSSGRVGVMDQRCPHRCASLFLGRNEENGLRCVYHGWKYDTEGNCVDMPNAPPHQDFKHKVKAKAYKVQERNGLIWVYMGARKEAPPLPAIEAALMPADDLQINFVQRECNWLQALEGDIDTSHFGFLHTGSVQPDEVPEDSLMRWTVVNRAPEYHITDTEYGTMYCAYRPAEPGQTYWRFANFLFPFWTQTPQGPFNRVNTRAWVPMDDTHTMFVSLSWRGSPTSMRPLKSGQMVPGSRLGFDYLPNTTDWYGRWRLSQNPSNDWMIDRQAQKTESFTGIASIHGQDQAVTESMGPITDHEFENLGPSDIMIARTRRRLLRAARAFAKDGKVPPGVDEPGIYTQVRSGDFVTDAKIAWRDAYDMQMRAAARPLQQAAD